MKVKVEIVNSQGEAFAVFDENVTCSSELLKLEIILGYSIKLEQLLQHYFDLEGDSNEQ